MTEEEAVKFVEWAVTSNAVCVMVISGRNGSGMKCSQFFGNGKMRMVQDSTLHTVDDFLAGVDWRNHGEKLPPGLTPSGQVKWIKDKTIKNDS